MTIRILTIVLLLSVLAAVTAYGFRPAPPSGTPKLVVDPVSRINYVYIDVVVLDTVAQVVFMAAVDISGWADSISITPDWPIDSVVVYAAEGTGSQEFREVARFDSPAVFPNVDGPLSLRITYETVVHRAISGPPGPWVYGRVFALYPPFEDSDGNLLPVNNVRIRFMLPPDMESTGCGDRLFDRSVVEGFVMWTLREDAELRTPCRFESIDG